MSEALTPEAPASEPAVPSVEDQAPGDAAAVASGSAGDERSIPVERFNGLMSKFNSTQAELERARAREAELEALLTTKETPSVSDNPELVEQVQRLTQALAERELKDARRSALDKYPEAKPFADLIVGNTAEDIESVAAALAERVRGILPAASTETVAATETTTEAAPEVPAATEAPVIAGGTAVDGDASAETRVQDAIARGDWSAYLSAKGEMATAELA